MTTTIPVNPEDYDLDAIKAELALIEKLKTALALYEEREFRQLPEQLQQQVHQLKSITQPTGSGLERVSSLLWQLAAAESLLGPLKNGESIANQVEAITNPGSHSFLLTGPTETEAAARAANRQQTEAPTAEPAIPTANQTDGTLTIDHEQAVSSKQQAAEPQSTPGTGTLVLEDEQAVKPQPTPEAGTLVLPDETR